MEGRHSRRKKPYEKATWRVVGRTGAGAEGSVSALDAGRVIVNVAPWPMPALDAVMVPP